jgi:hypothetical protein
VSHEIATLAKTVGTGETGDTKTALLFEEMAVGWVVGMESDVGFAAGFGNHQDTKCTKKTAEFATEAPERPVRMRHRGELKMW